MVRRGMGPAGDLSRSAGAAITQLREAQGLSTGELCRAAGMSQSYYYMRLRGSAPWTLNDIEALSVPLKAEPGDVFMAAVALGHGPDRP
jgi:transcriptional regulator with XRE-family HTH domain